MPSPGPTQVPIQQSNIRYSQHLHPSYSTYGGSTVALPQHTQPPHMQPQIMQPQYIQPHYADSQPPSFIAELPAPLPVAPETSTSQQQLVEDEKLARKLVQLEVQEARSRSSSNIDQQERPISLMPQGSPVLSHRSSSQALNNDSRRPSSGVPFHPESYGPPPGSMVEQSSLPEVVPTSSPGAEMSQLPEVVPSSLPTVAEPTSDSASLSAYLEKYRHVPYPPQWKLAPPVMTLYAHTNTSAKADWLEPPDSCTWQTTRRSAVSQSSPPPLYAFKFKTRSGSKFRDPKHSWVMTCNSPDENSKDKALKNRLPSWEYELRLDRNTGVRKDEALNAGEKRSILTTYVPAHNYDSLRFIGNDGRGYQWVSQVPLSTANGARYDTLRHALFASTGNILDPLYGEIVADHTYWDGFAGARPDEALYIRSATVQRSLVVASLQVLKDWQKRTLRNFREKNPEGFTQMECLAREQDLGRLSHWRGSDCASK